MEPRIDDVLAGGRRALQSGAWEEARALFEARAGSDGRPEAYEGLGAAALGRGDKATGFAAHEQAYRRFRECGDAQAVEVAGAPPVERLFEQYLAGGGEQFVCPICFQARRLEEAQLLPQARLAGTTCGELRPNRPRVAAQRLCQTALSATGPRRSGSPRQPRPGLRARRRDVLPA